MKKTSEIDASGLSLLEETISRLRMNGLTAMENRMSERGGSRILIETIESGQGRPYSASFYTSRIVAFTSHDRAGVPVPGKITRSVAKVLAKAFVRHYEDNPGPYDPCLLYCRPCELPYGIPHSKWGKSNQAGALADKGQVGLRLSDDGSENFLAECWEVSIKEPYSD